MSIPCWIVRFLVLAAALPSPSGRSCVAADLPDLPDPVGRAGMMAAVVVLPDGREAILAAGGANFPLRPPWEGGSKVFHREILLLEPAADGGAWRWRQVGSLPEPTAYAAFCASADRGGLVVAGGCSADAHHDAVLRVTPDGRVERFAEPLPRPLAYAGFGEHRGRLVILGGTTTPAASAAESRCLSLSLAAPEEGWTVGEADPRKAGILFFCGSVGERFVWGGGCGLSPGPDGVRRHSLDTVFQERLMFEESDPGSGETAGESGEDRVGAADAPTIRLERPLAAAAGPMVAWDGGLFIVGGDDGRYDGPPRDHPGQSRDVLWLDLQAGSCRKVGTWPTPIVTAPLLLLGDHLVTVSGETRPGVRTAAISRLAIRDLARRTRADGGRP
jgi:ACS family D-galactonate transporter-like MFS transporter